MGKVKNDERQNKLEKLGIHFLRFEDLEVKKNMNNVLRVIEDWIIKNKPTPNPSEEESFRNESTSQFVFDGKRISKPSGEGSY